MAGDLLLNEVLNCVPLLIVEEGLALFDEDLNDPPLFENFPVCFSIRTEFFPLRLGYLNIFDRFFGCT